MGIMIVDARLMHERSVAELCFVGLGEDAVMHLIYVCHHIHTIVRNANAGYYYYYYHYYCYY